MKEFLKQVAGHWYGQPLERMCFIFPNRRSMAFFNKHLAELAGGAGYTILAPKTLTVNDFFAEASGEICTDRISLLLALYDCYKVLYPKAEPLDDFIYWGDVLLADFNDVDKYLADPSQLYTNVADIKNLSDDFSYLTERQREAINTFISHFKGQKTAEGNVKHTFMQIWNILKPLYSGFREKLRSEGMAYEGMIYRGLAEKAKTEPVADILKRHFSDISKFVFVGLNALNECEKTVMRKMYEASLAEFCWDYCSDMIRHPLNRSSHFMSENIRMFPQAFKPEESRKDPDFNVVSVPSATGQVKQVPGILRRMGIGRDNAGDCAIVLADETLLMPLLSSIPPEIEDINITMGYPLNAGEFYSLMKDITNLQIHIRYGKDGSAGFYHKQVWDIISSGLFKKLTDGDDTVEATVRKVRNELKYYISLQDLDCSGDSFGANLLRSIFRPVVKNMSEASAQSIREFADYQMEIITLTAPVMAADEGLKLEVCFAREYYRCIKSLKDKSPEVTPGTYVHLLESLLAGVSVPFRGEPLKGLQIMGPLETRALDFKNVIILSCNEGVFPRRNVSSSFIPPLLRKGFGLPTYEYQDSVWAYYFYRLVTRAEKVWMVFDSRTEGLCSGEESRYVKQLRYHFWKDVHYHVAKNIIEPSKGNDDAIEKTDDDIRAIKNRRMSVSSLQKYLDCPAKFYFHFVKGLRQDDEVVENLDASMLGTVYHDTMRALFMGEEEMMSRGSFDKRDEHSTVGMKKVSRDYLKGWLEREADIRNKVSSLICSQLHTEEVAGRDLINAEVIVRYVLKTISRDIELLEHSSQEAFVIEGLEQPCYAEISGLQFFGIIDRVDRIGGLLRVCDYKSGKDDSNALAVKDDSASRVFEGSYDDRHKHKALLQFHIYNQMLRANGCKEPLSDTMYAVRNMFKTPLGIAIFPDSFENQMQKGLDALVGEILDKDIPFARTPDKQACENCDFKIICGK